MISALLSSALSEQASAANLEAWLAREAPELRADDLHDLAALLERYLNGLPSAVDALTAMTKDPRSGRGVAFAAGQALLYLVDEDDLFNDVELGPLGLLDDAYLIHACLAALQVAFPALAAPVGYAVPDEHEIAAVRALLPGGVAEALDQTCESLVGVAAALFSSGADGSRAQRPARPALRVAEAAGVHHVGAGAT